MPRGAYTYGRMKKRALLIGINDYRNYPEESLRGCVNDVEIMASVLVEKFDFAASDIILLLEEEATKNSIVEELKRIHRICEPNDIIVFYFSGHGTRRRSAEPGKPDGMEEVIMPYDSSDSNSDIRDSDIRSWVALLAKKTKNINLFFDSCYSGSMVRKGRRTRSAGGIGRREKIKGIDTDAKEIFLSPGKLSSPHPIFPPTTANWLALANSYALLSACQKDEPAREYLVIENGEIKHYAAFTYFLVQELRKAPPDFTSQDVFEQTRIKMRAMSIKQTPNGEGNMARQLFSDVETDPMQYVLVTRRSRNDIWLAAGAAHGIKKNSEWTIYRAGAKDVSEESKLGRARLIGAGAAEAVAKILEESEDQKILPGSRAVEETRSRDRKTSVFIDFHPTELKEMTTLTSKALEESSWLTLAAKESGADFVVSFSADEETDKNVRIRILQAESRQALLEINGFDEGSLTRIRETLEKLSKHSMILKLENPLSELKDLIEFKLFRLASDEWVEAQPFYDNLPRFLEGESIAFEVKNNSRKPIYVSLLELGLTKNIRLLYPPKAASEKLSSALGATVLKPGLGKFAFGMLPGEEIKLFIPDDSFLTVVPGEDEPGGIEVFKLVVTTEQTDFNWIEQAGIETREDFQKPLEKSLPEKTRMKKTRTYVPPNDWLTINRPFYLCKKKPASIS